MHRAALEALGQECSTVWQSPWQKGSVDPYGGGGKLVLPGLGYP